MINRGRKLTVNGFTYNYIVKAGHRPDHRDQKRNTVTVQASELNGQIFQYPVEYHTPITPIFMKTVILEARQRGWKPERRGPLFRLAENAIEFV